MGGERPNGNQNGPDSRANEPHVKRHGPDTPLGAPLLDPAVIESLRQAALKTKREREEIERQQQEEGRQQQVGEVEVGDKNAPDEGKPLTPADEAAAEVFTRLANLEKESEPPTNADPLRLNKRLLGGKTAAEEFGAAIKNFPQTRVGKALGRSARWTGEKAISPLEWVADRTEDKLRPFWLRTVDKWQNLWDQRAGEKAINRARRDRVSLYRRQKEVKQEIADLESKEHAHREKHDAGMRAAEAAGDTELLAQLRTSDALFMREVGGKLGRLRAQQNKFEQERPRADLKLEERQNRLESVRTNYLNQIRGYIQSKRDPVQYDTLQPKIERLKSAIDALGGAIISATQAKEVAERDREAFKKQSLFKQWWNKTKRQAIDGRIANAQTEINSATTRRNDAVNRRNAAIKAKKDVDKITQRFEAILADPRINPDARPPAASETPPAPVSPPPAPPVETPPVPAVETPPPPPAPGETPPAIGAPDAIPATREERQRMRDQMINTLRGARDAFKDWAKKKAEFSGGQLRGIRSARNSFNSLNPALIDPDRASDIKTRVDRVKELLDGLLSNERQHVGDEKVAALQRIVEELDPLLPASKKGKRGKR